MIKMIMAYAPIDKEFELIPVGNHVARCFQMIQMGTHKSEYMGKESLKEKVRITWELSNELREDGKPFVIGKEYTLSMAEMGNLRPTLESWRGQAFTSEEAKAFNITKVLGVPCLLNVIHEKSKDGNKTYANITGITPLPKGMPIPDQINETLVITIDDFKDSELEKKIPKFVFDKIKESEEYKKPLTLEQEYKASIQEPIVEDIKPEDLPH